MLTHRVPSKGVHSSQKLSKERPSMAKTERALAVFPLRRKGIYSNLIGKSLRDGGEPVQVRRIPSGICTLVPQVSGSLYGKRRRQPQILISCHDITKRRRDAFRAGPKSPEFWAGSQKFWPRYSGVNRISFRDRGGIKPPCKKWRRVGD